MRGANVEGRGDRHRDDPVLAADRSVALNENGYADAADAEIIDKHRRRNDVHDRIDGADLHPTTLVSGNARLGLCIGQNRERPLRQLTRPGLHVRGDG